MEETEQIIILENLRWTLKGDNVMKIPYFHFIDPPFSLIGHQSHFFKTFFQSSQYNYTI